MRRRYHWKLKTRELALGERTLIMGIVNVTPDSFSDGGESFHTDLAAQRALQLFEEGADIVDIGGESTRPGDYERISSEEEMRRVIPVIKAVLRHKADAVMSIDTYRAETAARAVRAGAEIINDVSGFLWDEQMPAAAAETRAGIVLMHCRGIPKDWKALPKLTPDEVMPVVMEGLCHSVQRAIRASVSAERIVIDPGIGFGKRFDENYPLLARLEELAGMNYPILCGASRKSFLARTIARRTGREELPAAQRLHGTIAANVAAILNGAHILRVHDVAPAIEAAAVADAILGAAEGPE